MRTHTRRSAEQWQALINEQTGSGLSAHVFCKQRDLGYASFCQWRKRLAHTSEPSASFVALEAPVKPVEQSRWAVELQLGQDVVLRISKQ